MGNHGSIRRARLGMLLQLRQEGFDLPLDLAPRGARLSFALWRVEQPVQLHQPVALAAQAPIPARTSLAPCQRNPKSDSGRPERRMATTGAITNAA